MEKHHMDAFEHITDNVDHKDVAMQAMAQKIAVLENQLFYARDDVQHKEFLIERLEEQINDQAECINDANRRLTQYHEDYRELQQQQNKRSAVMDLEELRFLMDPSQTLVQKIKAIKFVRSITRAGLKEAKEFVDQYHQDFSDFLTKFHIKTRHESGVDHVEFIPNVEEAE